MTQLRCNRRHMRSVAIALGLTVFARSSSADAEEAPNSGSRFVSDEHVVSLGVFSFSGPTYPGAERNGLFAYPTFEIRKPGKAFAARSVDDGPGIALFDTPTLKVGPVGALRPGRHARSDASLAGLDDSPWAIEAGVFADFWLSPETVRAHAELRHGVRGGDGFALDLSADLFQRAGRFTVSAGPRVGLLDSQLAQIEFGVSQVASTRNPFFASYQARGGLQTLGVSSTVDCDWSDAWRTTVYARYDHLVGDAANSTITQRLGAADQLTAGIGVTYSFRIDLSPLR